MRPRPRYVVSENDRKRDKERLRRIPLRHRIRLANDAIRAGRERGDVQIVERLAHRSASVDRVGSNAHCGSQERRARRKRERRGRRYLSDSREPG